MTAAATARTRSRRGLDFGRVNRRTRRRSRSALRHYPKLDGQVLAVSSVHRHYPVGADASGVDEVVLRSVAAPLRLARTTTSSAVADQVALRCRVVLQLNGEVIQPRLLVVEPDVPVLVHLARRRQRGQACR